MIKIIVCTLILVLTLQAKHLHQEKVYQKHFCTKFGGIMEYRLEDRTRVDCLLDEYAIEVDFAPKWAESVGQSLYYAAQTSRKAAVVLIMENMQQDKKYLHRLENVSKAHDIDIWIITKDFTIQKNTGR